MQKRNNALRILLRSAIANQRSFAFDGSNTENSWVRENNPSNAHFSEERPRRKILR
jgi:HD superfamily phosphodiesterase